MNDLFNKFSAQFGKPKEVEVTSPNQEVRETFIELPYTEAFNSYYRAYGAISPRDYQNYVYEPAMIAAGREAELNNTPGIDQVNQHFDKNMPKLSDRAIQGTDYTHMPEGMKEAQTANGVHDHRANPQTIEQALGPDKKKFEFLPVNITRTPELAKELQDDVSPVTETEFVVDPETDEKGQANFFDLLWEVNIVQDGKLMTGNFENNIFKEKSPEEKLESMQAQVDDVRSRYVKETPMLAKALQQSEADVLDLDREKTKQKVYLGIDPGKSGAIVAIDEKGNILSKDVIPLIGTDVDPKGIFDLVNQYKGKYNAVVILEEVHSLHKMAANTNFSMGHTLGIILGIVVASQLKLIRVQPKTWQKETWITSEIEYLPKKEDQLKPSINTKLTSMKAAHRLFPTADFRKNGRSKNDHDGICDAILLAEYGRRKNL